MINIHKDDETACNKYLFRKKKIYIVNLVNIIQVEKLLVFEANQ